MQAYLQCHFKAAEPVGIPTYYSESARSTFGIMRWYANRIGVFKTKKCVTCKLIYSAIFKLLSRLAYQSIIPKAHKALSG